MVQIVVSMPFRRGRSRGVVQSTKHIVDTEGALTNVTSQNVIATSVPAYSDPFTPTSVKFGEKIFGFFLSIFIIGATGAPVGGSQNWYIMKIHGGQTGDRPTPGQTGTSLLRNQIIHEEKGLAGSGDGTAMVFKGVIKVPRGMQRMREGDEWSIGLINNGTDGAQFCIKAIYKSFS